MGLLVGGCMIKYFCDLCESKIELPLGQSPGEVEIPITNPKNPEQSTLATCILCPACWDAIRKVVDGLRKPSADKANVGG